MGYFWFLSVFFQFFESIVLFAVVFAVSIYFEPILILLNLLYVILTTFLTIKTNKVNFVYGKERSSISRRAAYAKRVFYLPQYAQELRSFRELDAVIRDIYEESVRMESACIKQYGVVLTHLYIFSNVLRYTLSSYIPHLYLGVKAVATGAYTVGNFSLLPIPQSV